MAVLWLAVLTMHEQVFAQGKNVAPGDSVLRRFLLVASEGLYNALRTTPDGHYLVALRAEERFVEVSRAGNELLSFPVSGLPVMAQRLSNGDTLCTGGFGLVRFDKTGKNVWSFTKEDAAPHFPLIYAAGVFELPNKQLLVANSDWHFMDKDQNRVQAFVINTEKSIEWTLPASAFGSWKRSETEPRTGFLEHRVCLVQPLPL